MSLVSVGTVILNYIFKAVQYFFFLLKIAACIKHTVSRKLQLILHFFVLTASWSFT